MSKQTQVQLEIGMVALRATIETMEAKYPQMHLSRFNAQSPEFEDYEMSGELMRLFGTGGAAGHLGQTADGTLWNAGITKTGDEDEDGEEISEPVFGWWRRGLQGVTVWQGEYLIERVRDALKKKTRRFVVKRLSNEQVAENQ